MDKMKFPCIRICKNMEYYSGRPDLRRLPDNENPEMRIPLSRAAAVRDFSQSWPLCPAEESEGPQMKKLSIKSGNSVKMKESIKTRKFVRVNQEVGEMIGINIQNLQENRGKPGAWKRFLGCSTLFGKLSMDGIRETAETQAVRDLPEIKENGIINRIF